MNCGLVWLKSKNQIFETLMAIKELIARIETLETEVAALKE